MKDWEEYLREQEYINSAEYKKIQADEIRKKRLEEREVMAHQIIDGIIKPVFEHIKIEELIRSLKDDVWCKGQFDEIRRISTTESSGTHNQLTRFGTPLTSHMFVRMSEIKFGYSLWTYANGRTDWFEALSSFTYDGKKNASNEDVGYIQINSGVRFESEDQDRVITKTSINGCTWGSTYGEFPRRYMAPEYNAEVHTDVARRMSMGSPEQFKTILAMDCQRRTELGLMP